MKMIKTLIIAFILCLIVPTDNFDIGYLVLDQDSYDTLTAFQEEKDFNNKLSLTKLLMHNALKRAKEKNRIKHEKYLAKKRSKKNQAKSKFDVAKR